MSTTSPVPYNFTVEDTSSMVQYAPFGDGDMATGWQWVFLGPGPNDTAPLCGTHPEGISSHMTAARGATMSLVWLGQGIYLFGLSNSTYEVNVDGTTTSYSASSHGVLFTQDGLPHQTHNITVTVLPDSPDRVFSFDYALLTDITPQNVGKVTRLMHTDTHNDIFVYAPDSAWLVESDPQVPISTLPTPYRQTNNDGASVSMNFTNSIGVTLNGTRGCDHGLYSIALTDSTANTTYFETFNGSARWFMPDALLFYHAGLDPTHTYQVELTNSGDATLSLVYAKTHRVDQQLDPSKGTTNTDGLQPTTSVTVTSPSSDGSAVNVGAIVGPIVAVIMVLSLALIITIYVRLRHREEKGKIRTRPDTPVGSVSPYVSDPNSSMAPSTSGGKSRRLDVSTPTPHDLESSLTQTLPIAQSNTQTPTSSSSRRNQSSDIEHIVELVAQRIIRWPPPSPSVPAIPPPRYTR